jgi:hypothetical protein
MLDRYSTIGLLNPHSDIKLFVSILQIDIVCSKGCLEYEKE